MRGNKLDLLVKLAKRGAMLNSVYATTGALASELGVSQQTISRWLAELQAEALIERRGKRMLLNEKAGTMLAAMHEELRSAFEGGSRKLRLIGSVVSGMREGRFYLSIPGYKKQIRKVLGYDVFPGTLNLKLGDARSVDGKRRLMAAPGMEIAGFRKNGRLLGGAKLFRAKLGGMGRRTLEAAVIIPYKSHYGAEVLELVSREHLRKAMALAANQQVEVEVELRQ